MEAEMMSKSAPDAQDAPVFSAADLLRYRWRRAGPPEVQPPEAVVLCYQPGLLRYARSRYAARRVEGFFGELYILKAGGGRVGVSGNFGVGAPAAVLQLEELAAFGVRRFLSTGLAGGLQAESRPGDWLVCARALRDEGTSAHYLPPGRWADPHAGLTARLRNALDATGLSPACAPTWTTDAPYRELPGQVEACRKEGVHAVDMETAAVFAAGAALNVEVAAALVIADRITAGGWQPAEDMQPVMRSLERLLDAALRMLAEQNGEEALR